MSDIARASIRYRADVEEAAMRLAMVVPPALLQAAIDEVDRRTHLFAGIRTSSPRSGEHPRLAAFESVTHDATYGRFE